MKIYCCVTIKFFTLSANQRQQLWLIELTFLSSMFVVKLLSIKLLQESFSSFQFQRITQTSIHMLQLTMKISLKIIDISNDRNQSRTPPKTALTAQSATIATPPSTLSSQQCMLCNWSYIISSDQEVLTCPLSFIKFRWYIYVINKYIIRSQTTLEGRTKECTRGAYSQSYIQFLKTLQDFVYFLM